MNKNDLSNALTEVELSHKRGSAVFEEITRNLFEDTTPNPEYSCQYEHYVALADTSCGRISGMNETIVYHGVSFHLIPGQKPCFQYDIERAVYPSISPPI